MQEGDLQPDVGSNSEPLLDVCEGGHHLQVREGGPHLQKMIRGPILQVREGGSALQVRVGGQHAELRENHHRKQVKAALCQSHPLHLRGPNSRLQRVPPKPLPASFSPRE